MTGYRTGTRISVLLAAAAAAWLVTALRMEDMDMGMELGSLGWFAVTWVAMMAAMMLPALGPAVIRRRGSGALFVASYLVPWAAFGVLGYAVVEIAGAPEHAVAGALILAAAVYQLTPLKDRALRRCRGDRGTASGLEYASFCVTCCWAMMAALFALGVMSLAWMAVVAVLITAERLLPWRVATARGVAIVLMVLGVAVALT
jgi:predicted metal-binding membrane protein